MAVDHIRYDILAQEALRDMVRKVLVEIAKTGLKGEHHLNITFATGMPGVRIAPRLREQYPQEMTVVLQYQFWDLKVTADVFEVGLSFGGIPERLTIPFAAITGFVDPSVQFALQFQAIAEAANETADALARNEAESDQSVGKSGTAAKPASPKSAVPTVTAAPPLPDTAEAAKDGPATAKPGAEVVRLDRFRKK